MTKSADLLRWPVVGAMLRWRHARTTVQLVLLAIAAVVVLQGLAGSSRTPGSLSTVLIWVHYRGLLVIALLAAGNFFCFGCPFVLVRDAGRLLHRPLRHWPRRLRTKWPAIVLFVAVLFSYELFDLWALPAGTAWLVLAYFAAAMGIDLMFTGATFCKYLCPVGQFNFITSTLSPLELRVRETATCRTCRTADCIRGREPPPSRFGRFGEPGMTSKSKGIQRGCELGLFLPLKVGNMDCTFCLDCVQACPHDNIALTTRVPGAELAEPGRRSGIGILARRPDIGVLAGLFTFSALLSAFGMVAPVYQVEIWLSQWLSNLARTPIRSEWPLLAIIFVVVLGVVPFCLLGGASVLTRRLVGASGGSTLRTAATYVYALVPVGVGVWLAHYGFHLLTGVLTVIPLAQNAAMDAFGWAVFGEPVWRRVGMRPGSVWPIELGCLLVGALGSVAVAYRISEREYPARPRLAAAPWAILSVLLTLAALWIAAQPMEMRGTGFLG